MIVCVCKSVSDRTIRASIAEGMDSFDELQFELGVATCCGKCEESVRDVMAQSGVCASRCGVTRPQVAVVPHVVPMTFYERKAA
ncbi:MULTISPECIES: bacterioferritin-associated ferredoxin [Paraburkholderia]|uniref:Bacterioferritin-associated ferredoxin n=1 Tax=Paraburkholderia tropica TaxID=92647 RepID=A0A1A5XAM6_9BURK|nr:MULTISPECIES: (2Fe-2S)-binding protein [Paraburkholderia]MDE1142936.1 (2Fe-2S)-binding protein [Paraburkholderia tropica]OBR50230.1 (2Fe-2S)-binding protein [Paraburkholderia tropica]PXX13623.1 bacterioferritin-associated ferredoxin [Paraburkholderia tropica]PZW78554.1 bacterioferritin-associated ferredoxin [Paraburkholderia tropica]QNB12865.1 (2Fe-2S)-binding protein [Paraburkholderia tropica]